MVEPNVNTNGRSSAGTAVGGERRGLLRDSLFKFADPWLPGALESLCLYSLEIQGGLPSKRSPCAAQSEDRGVPKVKECY